MHLSDAQFEQYQRDGHVVGGCLDGRVVERVTDEVPPARVDSGDSSGAADSGCV